ncbi:hypothetical protein EAT1b_0168 [Exiguobacterium sp. AT1b]|uniref:Uncharacterized protein n=1 Tax=Exiguobacterium sp. (strain ATCC BAA-1283 / AT1b) TaxID=360911 RepID=C4L1F5_EXISA|nr:hypothetical protein EAT1b_0168 [Exiguobacterium sp. AT1b]
MGRVTQMVASYGGHLSCSEALTAESQIQTSNRLKEENE